MRPSKPDDRGSKESRKVRSPQGTVLANSQAGRPDGTVQQRGVVRRRGWRASPATARVKRWCKRPPASAAMSAARQTPPGARPSRCSGVTRSAPGRLHDGWSNSAAREMIIALPSGGVQKAAYGRLGRDFPRLFWLRKYPITHPRPNCIKPCRVKLLTRRAAYFAACSTVAAPP